jgi:hypothetical protein
MSQALIKRIAALEAKMRSVVARLAPGITYGYSGIDSEFTTYTRHEEPLQKAAGLPQRPRPPALVALTGNGLPKTPFF